MVKAPIGRARLHALAPPCFHESAQVPHELVFSIGPPSTGKIPIPPLWNHMFLNFDAMPPPLRGAARHLPALRPAGTVPPDMAPPERCPVVMVPLLRHGSTGHGIWCRLRPARYLGGTVPGGTPPVRLRRPGPAGYAIPAGRAIPLGHAFPPGAQSLRGARSLRVRNPSKSAICSSPQPLKARIVIGLKIRKN